MAEPIPEVPATVGRARRRLGAGVIDQAISGSTNVVIAIVAARELDEHRFGLFGVITLVYLLMISCTRSLVSEPALVHPPERARGGPMGTALALSFVLGGVVVVASLFGTPSNRGGLLLLAALFPLLTAQDVGRYLGFAAQRPIRACALDAIWWAGQALALAFVVVRGDASVAVLVVAWAGPGALAGAVALVMNRRTGLLPNLHWLRETSYLSWRYLVSFASTFGIAYAAALGLGAISGAESVGAVRGAQLVVSPFTMLLAAATNVITVEVSRRELVGPPLRQQMRTVSLAMAILAGALVAGGLALPRSIGEIVLGDTWDAARRLLVPAGLQIVLIGVWAGAKIGMTGLRRARETVRLDVGMAPVLLVVPVVGAVLGGAEGFYWCLSGTHALIAVAWWRSFRRWTDEGVGAAPLGAHRPG